MLAVRCGEVLIRVVPTVIQDVFDNDVVQRRVAVVARDRNGELHVPEPHDECYGERRHQGRAKRPPDVLAHLQPRQANRRGFDRRRVADLRSHVKIIVVLHDSREPNGARPTVVRADVAHEPRRHRGF